MNLCPRGYFGDALKACTYSPEVVTKCQKRISGTLLYRIVIHIEAPKIAPAHLAETLQDYRPKRLGE